MVSLAARLDDFANRATNRLIQRIPGPQIAVPTDRPIVSFTFDDVPESALTAGADILEKYDARGTFYIAGGIVGQHEPQRRLISAEGGLELARRGHELGCHTFGHHNVRHLYGRTLEQDNAASRAFFEQIAPGLRPRNFAYPYNAGSFRARQLLAQRFRSARGGLNGINRGMTDRTYLRGMPIDKSDERVLGLRRTVDEFVANPGWLIFFAHDIANQPTEHGCTPHSFEALVRHVLETGCKILTVNAALDRLGVAP
jgi:peptidoglycan/xylan/chitin deacetylase (PgdA/CDA1 family)